jgi:hypothetical protein
MKKQIILTKVFINTKSKDGSAYRSPMVNIYFNDDNGKSISASSFVQEGSPALDWQPGEKLTLEFIKKGDFINFVPPKPKDYGEEIKKIWEAIKALQGGAKPIQAVEEADESFFKEDLPF